MTAQQVIERMQKNLGVPWKQSSTDTVLAGSADTAVTGIVTTWTPSLGVLRRAVAAKKNMIIARESPYWLHETPNAEFSGAGAPFTRAQMAEDPTFKFKRDYIAQNNLVILRLFDNWNARQNDGQLRALTAALGWEKMRAGATPYFNLPSTSLLELTKSVQKRLNLHALRVLGDPQAQVRKIALSHGFLLVPALEELLKEPGVDVVVTGEPVEWEAHPYFDDWITAKKGKGMIMLGSQASEEPGSGEVATWLKSFITEVSVEWIAQGEPFWSANSNHKGGA